MAIITSAFDGSENPLSESGLWTNPTALGNLLKTSGVVAPSTASNAMARASTPALGADQYAQLAIVALSGGYVLPAVRLDASGQGYFIDFDSGILAIYRYPFAEVTSAAQALSGGDVVRIEAEGLTIRCKVNGVTVLSASDATFSAGQPGMFSYGSTSAQSDTFEAGDLAAAAAVSLPAPRASMQHILVR